MATSSKAAIAALGGTLALAAAATAWQMQRASASSPEEPKPTSSEVDEFPAGTHEVVVSKPNATEEEDSLTVKSTGSSSEQVPGEEEKPVDVTQDMTVDEEDQEQAEEEQEQAEGDQEQAEENAPASPDAEQVKAMGWDADEVPSHVRVVDGAMQYTGAVGEGARCVRALEPLTKPATFKTVTTKTIPAKKNGKKPVATATTKVVADHVSYFEVNLVQGSQEGLNETAEPPCVAVGISLHEFDWKKTMPGWNVLSFGYHGDDGTSFFARHKHTNGPTFGLGDTVGCGIDYTKRMVFYTKNGEFLGYSFELSNAQVKRIWIPTVGLDSHVAVQYNGQGPFKFDVSSL